MPHSSTRFSGNGNRATAHQSLVRGMQPLRGLAALSATLTTALARRRDRAFLARLDPHLLKDIGLTSAEVDHECAKTFWQP
ncbi:DUF1127 domain-containing protein [Tabrizicola sp.]|uniref:DUF1127 domain-containing protein n=1 Tax=Tabrizicola sp. TaxID=2005166 RepID=UPI0026232CC1|nr:DUF1127 domain-containing protein [Tabrizicola sp.]MDM7930654.1 DUF1127 domain-containing protein [Tabrizicola sp.]